jgi:hypothetical protein
MEFLMKILKVCFYIGLVAFGVNIVLYFAAAVFGLLAALWMKIYGCLKNTHTLPEDRQED